MFNSLDYCEVLSLLVKSLHPYSQDSPIKATINLHFSFKRSNPDALSKFLFKKDTYTYVQKKKI